jgi:DNA repair protein RadC
MPNPAVMDAGLTTPSIQETLSAEGASSCRAAPRLWLPQEPLPSEPPAAHPARSRKSKPDLKTGPAPASIVRDRYNPILKDLPLEERPRERLHAYGAQALTTAELIAILIRTGNAERSAVALGEFLLAEFGSIQGVATASLEQLAAVKGLGAAKAAQIKAAIEFGNRLTLFTEEGRPSISGPQDVSNLLMPDLRYQKKEHLKSLLLDTKNRVLAIKTVSVGDLSSSIVHPREVYKDAVIASAASIIVAHNHPSGDPTPSAEDVAVTKRLIQSGEIMGIDLLDHIVLGDGTFVSLKERGLI